MAPSARSTENAETSVYELRIIPQSGLPQSTPSTSFGAYYEMRNSVRELGSRPLRSSPYHGTGLDRAPGSELGVGSVSAGAGRSSAVHHTGSGGAVGGLRAASPLNRGG